MHYLFIWFLPFHSKDFYMIINIIDVILPIVTGGFLYRMLAQSGGFDNGQTIETVIAVQLIIAIVALILFFTERGYRHVIHKIYMFYRLFLTIFVFIFVLYSLFIAVTKNRLNTEYVLTWVGVFTFNGLNLYWSLELLKIIN